MLGRRDRRTDRTGLVVDTPYSRDFVEDLKDAVPPADRAWWPDQKLWWVSEDHEADVVALVVWIYGETIVMDEGGDETYLDEHGNESARQGRLL